MMPRDDDFSPIMRERVFGDATPASAEAGPPGHIARGADAGADAERVPH